MSFDCCHLYMECSDKGYCVNQYENLKNECTYRLKLRQGINFFSPEKSRKGAFIEVDGRQFKVNKLSSYGWSTYELSSDEREDLRGKLGPFGISVSGRKEISKCIKEPREKDEWACCKVRLTIGEVTYVIYNHNVRGITKKTAERIRNHLVDRGLAAAVEVVQTNKNAVQGQKPAPRLKTEAVQNEEPQARVQVKSKEYDDSWRMQPVKKVERQEPKEKQLSLFDTISGL
ncbi:hypothetical protein SAMN02745945_01801 [Peptoclostridium litorale DSM 5388]|uniref:Uncharacterized protein n=2 Tax=Peptoclostridium litorale TaxID=1557 RepID=A0A069RFY0_PEPLI|nr:hypothetical protein [Peptoclostridium litorale]KDR95926.1 hypothetical protein CLIT_8c00950 [Peptoclostridium litorale DSM 5388]SIO09851.1 hypothetical protein SAMN02745945_01801 [Peptoclostridium litorale DSM 5388]